MLRAVRLTAASTAVGVAAASIVVVMPLVGHLSTVMRHSARQWSVLALRQRTSQTVRRRSPRQMQMTTMKSQRRKRRVRSKRAQRLRAPSMIALPMRLSPMVLLRSGHPAPPPPPQTRLAAMDALEVCGELV